MCVRRKESECTSHRGTASWPLRTDVDAIFVKAVELLVSPTSQTPLSPGTKGGASAVTLGRESPSGRGRGCCF